MFYSCKKASRFRLAAAKIAGAERQSITSRQWRSSGPDMGQRQYLSRRMAEVMKRPKPLHEALN